VQIELCHVRMAVHNGSTARERCPQPLLAPGARAGIVHHADPYALDLHGCPVWQQRAKRLIVHVSRHGFHGAQLGQRRENAGSDEVAGMQDEVDLSEQPGALGWKSSGTAWQVRVGDDRDVRQG
jgi:hypothetical protein